MTERQAIDVALDMVGRPLLIRDVQRSPLPAGVRELISIAAGNETVLVEASKGRGRDPNTLRQAAIFFLQQVLFCSGADNYRTLGLSREATAEEIRDHRRLLLKWLHPDRNPSSWEQMLFQRVIKAAADIELQLAKQPATRAATRLAQARTSTSEDPSLLRTFYPAAIRRRPPPWQARIRIYLRRLTIAAILLTLSGGFWHLLAAEALKSSLLTQPHQIIGLYP